MWGHDFRPSYCRISPLRDQLGIPRLLALTASAPPKIRADIALQLGMAATHLALVSSCRRDNITLKREVKCLSVVARELKEKGARPAIVYVQTRSEVDEVSHFLRIIIPDSKVLGYHAGLSNDEREKAQKAFLDSNARDTIMVATCAFGMGINKLDIRTVVHFGGKSEQPLQYTPPET